ncbi:hypothetical protein ACFL3B_00090 [Gemmatimonadota bacterium]
MKPVRRLLVTVGAPLILVVGVASAVGIRKGSELINQVEAWGDSLEHSSGPVVLRVGMVPIISNLYVDGDRVGKFDRIVVLRHEPGGVDSLRIVVEVPNSGHLAHLSECNLQADPESLEGDFPEGLKHVMRCVSEADGLVPFGSVVFEGTDRSTTLLVEPDLVPCETSGSHADCMDMRELRRDMEHLREEIRHDIRTNARRIRARRN